MPEWFADESFWETLYPFLFPTERIEAAADELDRILELIDFEGREVLDLCCGPGRHAVDLARRGFAVTGVDRSPFLLAKAEERAAANSVEVEWVLSDMRDFSRPDGFDLVINLFTSFGYFDDPADDLRVLQNIKVSLRPGGCLVMQIAGKEQVARVFQPSSADEIEGAGLIVQQREVYDDWSRIRNTWTVIRDGEATSLEFHHTIYSARELKDLLASVGFNELRVYGDLDGNPYGPGAERLVVVAVASPPR